MRPAGAIGPSKCQGQRRVLASQGKGRVTPEYTKLVGKAMLFPYV